MIPQRSLRFLLGVYNRRKLSTSSVINHPPDLLDDLVRRGFIHDVTRYVSLAPIGLVLTPTLIDAITSAFHSKQRRVYTLE
jgi:hypothetical protein